MTASSRIARAAAVALLAATPAMAGSAYLEQVVTTGPMMGQKGSTTTQKVWIAEDRIRAEDGSSGVVSILRQDTGKFYMINTKDKTYAEMPIEQVKAMAAMGMAMLGGQGEMKAEVAETGETGKVGEWNARKVMLTITGPMENHTALWLSKDIALDMKAWINFAESFGVRGLMGGALEKLSALEGYPVKQETRMKMMGMEVTSTSELKVFRPGPVEPALFDPPADFKKTEGMMPAMAGAGHGE